jgi:hypothetical protein
MQLVIAGSVFLGLILVTLSGSLHFADFGV